MPSGFLHGRGHLLINNWVQRPAQLFLTVNRHNQNQQPDALRCTAVVASSTVLQFIAMLACIYAVVSGEYYATRALYQVNTVLTFYSSTVFSVAALESRVAYNMQFCSLELHNMQFCSCKLYKSAVLQLSPGLVYTYLI